MQDFKDKYFSYREAQIALRGASSHSDSRVCSTTPAPNSTLHLANTMTNFGVPLRQTAMMTTWRTRVNGATATCKHYAHSGPAVVTRMAGYVSL